MTALDGRVAIVTGGGRGIGRAVAEAFARAGAAVVVCARTGADVEEVVAGIRAAGGRASGVAGDVADPATADRLVASALGGFGACDVLVNAAGVQGPVGEVETLPVDAWTATVRANLTGTFLACRAVLPEMKRRRRGAIINVASALATRVQPGQSCYSATKAAVLHFTRVLAAEVAEFGVRANVVHPGIVRTRMVTQILALEPVGARARVVERMRQLERDGAILEPDQSARLFLWLARASEPTGAFVRIDDPAVREAIGLE